jgi:hypothetical protein
MIFIEFSTPISQRRVRRLPTKRHISSFAASRYTPSERRATITRAFKRMKLSEVIHKFFKLELT